MAALQIRKSPTGQIHLNTFCFQPTLEQEGFLRWGQYLLTHGAPQNIRAEGLKIWDERLAREKVLGEKKLLSAL